MSNSPALFNNTVIRVYGGGAPGGEFGNPNYGVTEALPVATYRRAIRGSKKNGHFSMQTFVDSAAGAASQLTVWYSNHPNPDLANDNDWTQDTSITAQDLTSMASKFLNVGNAFAEWIMIKVVIAASQGSIRVFARTEGTSVSAP